MWGAGYLRYLAQVVEVLERYCHRCGGRGLACGRYIGRERAGAWSWRLTGAVPDPTIGTCSEYPGLGLNNK